MKLINIITDNPSQKMSLKLDNGQSINITFNYSYNQSGWFYSFTYGTYKVNNRRVVNSVNMLRPLRNVLPFGLACLMTDKYEPIFVDDFQKLRASINVLNQDDVSQVETLIGSV